jgi:hypothetical protein
MTKLPGYIPAAFILALLFPGAGSAQAPPAPKPAIIPDFRVHIVGVADDAAVFDAKIDRYFALRSRLELGLPAVVVTTDVAQIKRGTLSLAHAIRRARPGAVEGDFFSAATGLEMRRALAIVVDADTWILIMDDNPGSFRSPIDGPYPDGKKHAMMPGTVLARLPQLPDDIEFRFIGPHLILYDVRANTIIDRLPNAIGTKPKASRR